MSVIQPKCFSHISLHVSDMDKSVDFYRDVLGLEVMFDIDLSGAGLDAIVESSGSHGRMVGCLVPGGTMIELVEGVRVVAEGPVAEENFIFSLSVDSVDEAHIALLKEGIAPVQPPTEIAGVRMFFIEDPDGHRAELLELPGGLKRASELHGHSD